MLDKQFFLHQSLSGHFMVAISIMLNKNNISNVNYSQLRISLIKKIK